MKQLIYCRIENEKICFEAVAENRGEIASYLIETYDINHVVIDIDKNEISIKFNGDTAEYFGTLKQITKL